MLSQGMKLGHISERICEMAIERGTPDNTSLIIVDLYKYYADYHGLEQRPSSQPDPSLRPFCNLPHLSIRVHKSDETAKLQLGAGGLILP
jgi:hypothetical protein